MENTKSAHWNGARTLRGLLINIMMASLAEEFFPASERLHRIPRADLKMLCFRSQSLRNAFPSLDTSFRPVRSLNVFLIWLRMSSTAGGTPGSLRSMFQNETRAQGTRVKPLFLQRMKPQPAGTEALKVAEQPQIFLIYRILRAKLYLS